jgi:hypothetical protein
VRSFLLKKTRTEEEMQRHNSIVLAIAMVIANISAIPIASARPSVSPSDILTLTNREKRLAWRDLHWRAMHYHEVPGFEPIDHWVLPPTVTVKPVTHRAARDVPALAGYDFAIVEGVLLIVNPTDRAVAEVIAPHLASLHGW